MVMGGAALALDRAVPRPAGADVAVFLDPVPTPDARSLAPMITGSRPEYVFSDGVIAQGKSRPKTGSELVLTATVSALFTPNARNRPPDRHHRRLPCGQSQPQNLYRNILI